MNELLDASYATNGKQQEMISQFSQKIQELNIEIQQWHERWEEKEREAKEWEDIQQEWNQRLHEYEVTISQLKEEREQAAIDVKEFEELLDKKTQEAAEWEDRAVRLQEELEWEKRARLQQQFSPVAMTSEGNRLALVAKEALEEHRESQQNMTFPEVSKEEMKEESEDAALLTVLNKDSTHQTRVSTAKLSHDIYQYGTKGGSTRSMRTAKSMEEEEQYVLFAIFPRLMHCV